MAETIRALRGMFDILPQEIPLWLKLERAARDAFERYGYGEIRTPLLEETRLFVRGIGDTTDIVEKEMYTIPSRTGEDSVTLRPEATAGVVRAYLENNFHKTAPLQKLGYMGQMFRYERPQAGRQRQFNQVGVELLGTYAPEADVETIALAMDILSGVGLSGTRLKINSIGCPKCRPAYREAVRAYIGDRIDKLCPDCRRRLERNVFRLLDCKNDACKAIIGQAPDILDYLDEECAKHFETVKSLLRKLGIEYTREKLLVRGLDYYTRTVYEMAHGALGARDAVGGGGRYDNLVEELGGPPTGAVGFSLGSEATLLALRNSGGAEAVVESARPVYVVVVDHAAAAEAMALTQAMRNAGLAAEMPLEGRSVKAQMRAANRANAAFAVILGPEEVAAGQAKVKSMTEGTEATVALGEVADFIRKAIGCRL